jgi:hypothetical protein
MPRRLLSIPMGIVHKPVRPDAQDGRLLYMECGRRLAYFGDRFPRRVLDAAEKCAGCYASI